jgi:purine nucleosidase
VKILLDTDIGSDIDDALCLAYLLAQPQCELLGVTTVSGEPNERAKLASSLCKAAGKNVPIYPGVENPLLAKQRQPRCPQSAALDRWEHETSFPQGEAIEFLRRTIHAYPGEITLLAIGPMTNVGLLFATDPQIPTLLKGLVMMVGVFTNRLAGVGPLEWNAICDPHAIAIVYRTPVAIHRSIGLDVTCQVRMNVKEVRQRFQTPRLRPVLDFAEVWFEERDEIIFHDPLAATTLFDDAICTFTRGSVEVELVSDRTAGMTYWKAGDGAHEVALEVKPERFFEHYFDVLSS